MAIHHIPHPRKWNHKHIILVTLTGTLVVTTMAAIISIILSPAHIFFTVEKPTSGKADKEDTKLYNFTLVAHNGSPRMTALYGALRAEIWYSQQTASVPAVVVDGNSLQDGTTRQKPTYINLSAEYWLADEQTSTPSTAASSTSGGERVPGTNEKDWVSCLVLVTATVWFKYGWISTRSSYNVRAYCAPVNFVNSTGGSVVNCTD